MNTLTSRFVAIMALALLLGMAAPAVAGPFDKSNERCETISSLKCAVIQSHVTKIYTIGDVVSSNTKRPFSDILELNGWEEGEVTPDTVIPKGKKFAIRGRI